MGGGLPRRGSFSRSALVRAVGARTRLAGGIPGLVVLALLPFAAVLGHLPEAVLGAKHHRGRRGRHHRRHGAPCAFGRRGGGRARRRGRRRSAPGREDHPPSGSQ
ncbi:MAG: SulP family inorganic anion transporter [Actinomycetota bacterium]